MGGGFALMLVSGHGFSAASINCGGKLPPHVDDFLKAPCPVIGSYGGLARFEKGAADQLQRALERALAPFDVKEYPGAGHSFMNHHRGYFIFKVLRYRDIGYNQEATLDARHRIAAFFHAHLDREWTSWALTRRTTRFSARFLPVSCRVGGPDAG